MTWFPYSYKAADKAAAKAQGATEFDAQIEAQSNGNAELARYAPHKAAVLASADLAIDALTDDATKDISVSVNAWVSQDENGKVLQVSLNTMASYAERPAAAPEAAEQSSEPATA